MAVFNSANKENLLEVSMPFSTEIREDIPKKLEKAKKFFWDKMEDEENMKKKCEFIQARAMLTWIEYYDVSLKDIKQDPKNYFLFFTFFFESKEYMTECQKELPIYVPGITTKIIAAK